MKADNILIRTARFGAGMTQTDLAKAAGVCLTTILKAERGKSISAKSNGKIKKALNLE